MSYAEYFKKKTKKKSRSEMQTYHPESTFFYISYYIYPINEYQK